MRVCFTGISEYIVSTEPILIAGCGDVGCQLGINLIAAGHRVYGLRRNINQLPPGIQGIAADLGQPQQLQNGLAPLAQSPAVVVYAVAAGGRTEQQYRDAYVNGLRNLLQALQHQQIRPRLLVFVSSTAVYGQQDDQWIDERSVTEPAGFSGRIMLEAEQAALNSGLKATVVRFSGIYGPGRNYMLNQVRSGIGFAPEPPRYSNRIHRDDCARVLQHLISLSETTPLEPVYLASDCEPALLHEVTHWLAGQTGSRITEYSAQRSAGSKRCSNQRLIDSGYQFRYPNFRDGYSAMLK